MTDRPDEVNIASMCAGASQMSSEDSRSKAIKHVRGRRISPLTTVLVVLGFGAIVCSSQGQADDAAAERLGAQANAALIKGAYEAFSRGDTQSVFRAFAENIVWHVPGRGPLSRDYRGHAEVAEFFDHFMGLSEGTFRIKIDDILASGDRVVVLCTETARRGGRSWASPQVHVWTVKDGRATAFWEYEGDQQAEDEFWSTP